MTEFRLVGVATAALVSAALLSGGVFAKGPGSGGGGPGDSGTSPDLGDLFVLYRDANGVPVLTAEQEVTDPETGQLIVGGSCQQPVALPGSFSCETTPGGDCLIPVDPVTCAVQPGYATYTQEVDFGRTSVVRSPVSVLESQLEDAVVNLSTADCITLDPAGRLVTSTVADTGVSSSAIDGSLQNAATGKPLTLGGHLAAETEPLTSSAGPLASASDSDGVVSSAAIDSPLQNLAMYWRLMLTGNLGDASVPLVLPGQNLLDTAARALGAASDKTGKVSVDMVVYLNQILGLTDPATQTALPKQCIDVREEVQGVVQWVQKCFLLYGNSYHYDRESNFSTLPDPGYIPGDGPIDGWFEYLDPLDTTTPLFTIVQGPILNAVFTDQALKGNNIGGFAQAADDARAVIDFMHTWPVPGLYATPLTCTASGGSGSYDVSISDRSGLQVPVRIVDGSEGREFSVTVANAGPGPATGSVTVSAADTATDASVATFPRTFYFSALAPGASQTWTEVFSVDLGHATTIAWRAAATAVSDVNPANNTVNATTTVRLTGGGGGR